MGRKTLTREQALDTVREYKRVIQSRYRTEPRGVMYGSYAKGYANPDIDIDVAVILPGSDITDRWEQSADLWSDIRKVSVLIEPVLMEDNEDSMLYREVMRTGVTMTLALAFTGVLASWAQDEVTVNPTPNANEWTLEMLDADVELEVTYYTDEELAEMEEAAFTAGLELTKASNGEWSLAEMPGFDIELEVEYETDLALNEVDDNTDALAEWDGYEADVTLTRTLAAGGWDTLAVPFSADAATLGLSAAKELESATLEGQTLTLNFKDATSIEAGKPYLVKVAANVENPTFDGVIVSSAAEPTTTAVVDFIPTLGATTITGDDAKTVLFLAAENKLKNPTALPTLMKGFRAYFQLKGEGAAARSFSLNLGDGEATGISLTPSPSPNGEGSVYDLQGRRMANGQSSMVRSALPLRSKNGQSLKKGVYIVNGKKVIIK